MTKSVLHQYIVTPEMVKGIQTLTGKQLHITVDIEHCNSITRFLNKYESVIARFIKDNNTTEFHVKAFSTETEVNSRVVFVVIISIVK